MMCGFFSLNSSDFRIKLKTFKPGGEYFPGGHFSDPAVSSVDVSYRSSAEFPLEQIKQLKTQTNKFRSNSDSATM